MPPRPTPERIVVLILVLTATVAACENKATDVARTEVQPVSQSGSKRSWNVVPALGIRG